MNATDQFIAAVREESDIESVAASYGHVTVHPDRLLTTCPCHDDTTPSLSLDPANQLCKCWLCLAQGDVFWMVMEHEECSLRDAVRLLADRIGFTEPPDLPWAASQLQRQHATTAPDSRRRASALRSPGVPLRQRI